MRLDFSQFHDLCHWPFTQRCRSMPGGWRRHLHLAWWLRRDARVYALIRRPLCWLDRHGWQTWRLYREGLQEALSGHQGLGAPGDYRAVCRYCHTVRTATEDEWW